MRIYNPNYRVRVAYRRCGWCVKYQRQGWFRRWELLREAKEPIAPYYIPTNIEMVPVHRHHFGDAKIVAYQVQTEPALDGWLEKEQKKRKTFWEQKEELHRERHGCIINKPTAGSSVPSNYGKVW